MLILQYFNGGTRLMIYLAMKYILQVKFKIQPA